MILEFRVEFRGHDTYLRSEQLSMLSPEFPRIRPKKHLNCTAGTELLTAKIGVHFLAFTQSGPFN